MVEKSQEYLRLALAAAVILIGLSVAYHYVIYVPEKDRQLELAAESKAQAATLQAISSKAEEDKAAQNRRANYRVCVSNAFSDYHSRWNSTCKRLADAADHDRSACLQGGGSEGTCRSSYPARPAADCALPNQMSDTYGASLKDDQQQCLNEAKAGVLDSSD